MSTFDLSALVAAQAQRFPWYGQLLRDAGVGVDAPLDQLPVVDEAVLLQHYYSQSDPGLIDAAVYRTSGTSSGKLKAIWWSPADQTAYVDNRRAVMGSFLSDIAPNAVAVADLGTGHAAASAARIFAELGLTAHEIDFTLPVEQHVELLNQWQPEVLFTMPMILDRLIDANSGLAIAPKKVTLLGDLAPDNWRKHVANVFNIDFADVLDLYGSIEVGAIAYFDHTNNVYQLHRDLIAEIAEDGTLLLTSFVRDYLPVVRFATKDVIAGLRTTDFGDGPVQVFDRIEGRAGGEVKHGERLSSYDIMTAVNEVLPAAVFEVVDNGFVDIRIVVDKIDAQQVNEIRRRLNEASPAVAQMIASGLIGDVQITAIAAADMTTRGAKRMIKTSAS